MGCECPNCPRQPGSTDTVILSGTTVRSSECFCQNQPTMARIGPHHRLWMARSQHDNDRSFNIIINAAGDDILLIWQAACRAVLRAPILSVFGKWRAAWSDPDVMLDQMIGCAQENKIYRLSQGTRLLQTIIKDECICLPGMENFGVIHSRKAPYSFTDPLTNTRSACAAAIDSVAQ